MKNKNNTEEAILNLILDVSRAQAANSTKTFTKAQLKAMYSNRIESILGAAKPAKFYGHGDVDKVDWLIRSR